MGWAGGSDLFSDVIKAAKKAIPNDETRKQFYRETIDAFQCKDWDTLDECLGEDPVYDEVYYDIYPPEEDED